MLYVCRQERTGTVTEEGDACFRKAAIHSGWLPGKAAHESHANVASWCDEDAAGIQISHKALAPGVQPIYPLGQLGAHLQHPTADETAVKDHHYCYWETPELNESSLQSAAGNAPN